jgi:hypothetical protein
MAFIDTNALNRLIGRLLSHTDILAGWVNLPPEIAKDIHSATCILDELSELLDCIDRATTPRAVAHTLVGLDAEGA